MNPLGGRDVAPGKMYKCPPKSLYWKILAPIRDAVRPECYEQSAEEYAAAADRQGNPAKHLERLWRFAARYAIAGHRFSSQQLRMG